MRVLVQRCDQAKVSACEKILGQIDVGLMLLVGFTEGDDSNTIDYMIDNTIIADDLINSGIFDDNDGVMNKSLLDVCGSILSVSQFTLYADTSKGRRPNYLKALSGEKATILYDEFNNKIKEKGINIQMGLFGANMKVEFINNGPVTIMLEK